MRRLMLVLPLLLLAAAPAWAGKCVLAVQVGQGNGDFVNPMDPAAPSGFLSISNDTRGEAEAGGEFWYRFTEDYAFNLSGAYGFFSEKDQPGKDAGAAAKEQRYSSTGFKVRLGGDRMVDLGHRLTFLAGPGLEWWSGKAKYENVYSTASVESPTTTRFALSGRVGAILSLSGSLGIVGRVGTTVGYASAKDRGAKTQWWPVGYESAWGISYGFGSK